MIKRLVGCQHPKREINTHIFVDVAVCGATLMIIEGVVIVTVNVC
jgi:hypothetical protein